MPFKHHAAHRHPFPRATYRVTNWPVYKAGLRQRGSLTVWFSEDTIRAWRTAPRTTRGGQPPLWVPIPSTPAPSIYTEST